MAHALEAMIGAFAYVTADGHVMSGPGMPSEGQVTDVVGVRGKNWPDGLCQIRLKLAGSMQCWGDRGTASPSLAELTSCKAV